ncbi:hypothetical protein D9Q98_009395 [Chlorella vulgaris]|uniref:Secreted protein n=1 Tax=Chlorella vulgaris TaxID=3077 RepID=A0A9D4YX65_CHLVU|nr:hypothetical protein D9Q98_009395 [Chlorella vulgaris]
MRVPHFLLLALVCTASTVQAGIFDDIANGISTAAGAVVGAGATAVDGVVGVANDVGDAVVNAGQTAWNWTQNSAEWVQCKAVDLTVFNFDPCWEAPPSDLCTEACKNELDQLPQACRDRFLSETLSSADAATVDRLESQIVACNIEYAGITDELAPAPAPEPAPLV